MNVHCCGVFSNGLSFLLVIHCADAGPAKSNHAAAPKSTFIASPSQPIRSHGAKHVHVNFVTNPLDVLVTNRRQSSPSASVPRVLRILNTPPGPCKHDLDTDTLDTTEALAIMSPRALLAHIGATSIITHSATRLRQSLPWRARSGYGYWARRGASGRGTRGWREEAYGVYTSNRAIHL